MRTTIVSTANLKNYKRFIFFIDAVALSVLVGLLVNVYSQNGNATDYTLLIIIYLNFHIFYLTFLQLRSVSFDESFIYFTKKGYEVQVPFEDVKSIQIETITGIYSIEFSQPVQGDRKVFCKTSIWYPFNYKNKDELINDLRKRIDAYKRSRAKQNHADLASYHL